MKPRLLIVDDNHDLADNLAELLEDEGYAVETAYSGELALALAESAAFDTVLTDVRMPGISGVDLIKQLRTLNPTTSFLLMTAYSSDAVLSEAVRAGVRAVLSKPVDIDLLLARLPHDVVSVLVVASDPAVGDELTTALRDRGYSAEIETMAAAVTTRISTGEYDAVVLDGVISECDSAELARTLCLEHGVPVVLLVHGPSGAARVIESLPAASTCFLAKPFETDALFEAVRSIVGERVRL